MRLLLFILLLPVFASAQNDTYKTKRYHKYGANYLRMTVGNSIGLQIDSTGKLIRYNNTVPTDGKLLIGDTGNGWILNNITSTNGGITVTNGAGTINLVVNVVGTGTYTPTLTNTANLDASTAHVFQYSWVIDPTTGLQVVTVSGYVDVDPTTTVTDTQLTISVPIASAFANVQECGGVAYATAIAAQGAGIRAVASTGNVMMQWRAVDVTNQPMYLTFTYKVTPP